MNWVWPKIRALVRGGGSVIPIFAIVALVFVTSISTSDWWLKLVVILLLGIPIVIFAIRMIRGTEEGSTDIEYVRGDTAFRLYGLPQAALLTTVAYVLESLAGARRRPLPRPAGKIKGNPAVDSDLVEDATVSVPTGVEITDIPPPLPVGTSGVVLSQDTIGVGLTERGHTEEIEKGEGPLTS